MKKWTVLDVYRTGTVSPSAHLNMRRNDERHKQSQTELTDSTHYTQTYRDRNTSVNLFYTKRGTAKCDITMFKMYRFLLLLSNVNDQKAYLHAESPWNIQLWLYNIYGFNYSFYP